MRRLQLVVILFFFAAIPLRAQTDSTLVFTAQAFLAQVKTNHPVARQAALLPAQGDAAVVLARGAFDPKAGTDLNQKFFDEKNYYSQLQAGLKIPTWFGAEVKAGFEQNGGIYLNPEEKTPAAGLWYAGVSVPVGQGLVIDERRKVLKQAQLFREATAFEQQLQLNQLLYDAADRYWAWFQAWHNKTVYESAEEVARRRFDGIRISAFAGDRPFVDTLEAGIQVQDRQLQVQQATLELLQRKLELENFLWTENNEPLELGDRVQPQPFSGTDVLPLLTATERQQIDSVGGVHPAVLLYNNKIDGLLLEQRWKRDKLKPVLNLNYNPLATGPDAFAAYSINNYKWGMTFSMPLLLRKERGDLQLTQLKIKETRYDLQFKKLEVRNKIELQLQAFAISREQALLYTRTVRDYESLVNAERRMFDAGESSLFMVNAREQSYFNARLKLNELIAKNNKAYAGSFYAAGLLPR